MKGYDSLHAFCQNAWEWDQHRSIDDYNKFNYFKARFLVVYDVIVTAVVSDNEESIGCDGHLGVLWLEAEWENGNNLSYNDLECMLKGIALAEENLLRNGIPFTEGYKFHGKNIANKARRNVKIRKDLRLPEIEEGMGY